MPLNAGGHGRRLGLVGPCALHDAQFRSAHAYSRLVFKSFKVGDQDRYQTEGSTIAKLLLYLHIDKEACSLATGRPRSSCRFVYHSCSCP